MDQIIKYGGVESNPLYNCSAMPTESWTSQFGMPRPVLGILSMSYGTLMEILFIPCLLAMKDKDLWRLSCYKIMFFVGIVDMFALAMNSISTGYLAYEGAVFCTHPVFIYLVGLCGLGLWCCSCLMNILLLVNRTLNVSNSRLSDYFFEGYRTYLVLLIPLAYGLYFVFFTPTCVFSSKYYAWFYDPFIYPNRTSEYTNVAHGINNLMIMCGTFFFYGYICFVLCKASKAGKCSKVQIQSYQILYQSVAVCFINQVSSSVYVVMNFVTVPEWLIVFAQLLWQLDHGDLLLLYSNPYPFPGCPVIIYMTMNPTIRSRFWRKVTLKKRPTSSVQTTSIRPMPLQRDI